MKYSKKIIIDYINGEKMNESSLENDIDFLKSVIFVSNDKNMYNRFSKEQKLDYDMILFLVNKFSDDKEYVSNITNYYLSNSNDPIKNYELVLFLVNRFSDDKEYIYNIANSYISNSKSPIKNHELIITMSKLLKNSCYGKKYEEYLKKKYHTILKKKDNYIKKHPEKRDIIEFGFFKIIKYSYYQSKIITDYYAKIFINELISKFEFEEYVHKNFNSFEEFEKNYINSIINYVSMYDYSLSYYIKIYVDLLTNINFDNIKYNWKKYIDRIEDIKYSILTEELECYMFGQDDSKIATFSMILYVSKKMGILDKIVKYTKYDYDFALEHLDNIEVEKTIKNSIPDRINYLNCKKIIEEILYKGNLEYTYNEEKCEDIEDKGRIFYFNK